MLFDKDTTEGVKAVVYNGGQIHWIMGGDYTVTCKMDITLFPFDNQTCCVQLSSYSLPETSVKFVRMVIHFFTVTCFISFINVSLYISSPGG